MKTPRNAEARDFPAILELNAGSVQFLSPLDAARLERLHRAAAYHRVLEADGRIAAFLLAFRPGADYDSPNYRWFAERYPSFLYIDRVVVDPQQRRLGLGAALYSDVIDFAARAGDALLTCEFYLDPPNPVSQSFHERHGFREVGTQWVWNATKQVSLQAREIAHR